MITSLMERPYQKFLLLSVILLVPGTASLAVSTTGKTMSQFSFDAGESALRQVQWLGSRVAEKEDQYEQERSIRQKQIFSDTAKVDGIGGSVINSQKRQILDYQKYVAEQRSEMPNKLKQNMSPAKERQVWEALANLEQDMQLLDNLAGQRPQLSVLEFTLLSAAVSAAASSPLFLGGHLTGVLAPSAAAFTAAIGIGAEYTGKVAVADGKEIAAACIQCAAEAEGFLAQAERSKAIMPLCVGISATTATLALLVPVLLDSAGFMGGNLPLVSEIYLCCPLGGVLSAAVASLAYRETKNFCQQAIGVGNRRFARSGLVGRTWLSNTEQITQKSKIAMNKWRTFAIAVLPSPLLAALVPGALPTKTIVAAALAAAQTAYYLAQAESVLGRATDAVALKARSAAVCDTYANQGARSAAILPFTSALCGLCAAATAAIVELPFLETLAAAGTVAGSIGQVVTVASFPVLSALFAAAASVSKARCEVDAEAAMQAASTLALPYDDDDNDPILKPLAAVVELIRLNFRNSIKEPFQRLLRRMNLFRRLRVIRRWRRRKSLSSALP